MPRQYPEIPLGTVRRQGIWDVSELTGHWRVLAHPVEGSGRLALMGQAAVSDGQFLDLLPFGQDGSASAEVDVCGGEVAQVSVVAMVVVVGDEGGDGDLEWPGRK